MRVKAILILTAFAVVTGCALHEDQNDAAIKSYVREVTGDDGKTPGRLQVSVTDVTTDGRIAKFRGNVQNKFDAPVEGIRYVVTMYGAPERKIIDRWEREVDTTLEPGERRLLHLDVESMYFGSSGGRSVNVEAYPVKVGEQLMPPPEGWTK